MMMAAERPVPELRSTAAGYSYAAQRRKTKLADARSSHHIKDEIDPRIVYSAP